MSEKSIERKENFRRAKEIFLVLSENKVFSGATPEKVREVLVQLGPTYVKLGQIMSSRPDMIPPEYCEEFKKLCSDVPPMEFEKVKELVEASTGRELNEIFSQFDEEALGAASVAQVHRAVTVKGEQVVVKVQREGILEVMEKDVKLMRQAVKFLPAKFKSSVDFGEVIDEFWKTTQEELNFLNEANNLETFYHNNSDLVYISCPKPYKEYSTDKVLVMEAINGVMLDNHEELIKRGYDLEEIGAKMTDNYIRQVLDDGFFHADPHQGNVIIRDGQIVWIDLGMVGKLSKNDREEMKKVIFAITENDTSTVVDFALTVGIYKEIPDRSALYECINALLNKYMSSDLSKIDMAVLFDEMMDALSEFQIKMPSCYTMLIRGIATIEGVIADLCPNVQLMEIAKNWISDHFLTPENLKEMLRQKSRKIIASTSKTMELPGIITDILRSYQKNDTRIKSDLSPSKDMKLTLFALMQDLVLGLALMGLLIGSAIICTADMQPKIWGMPVIAFIGFILAILCAVALILRNWRKRR